MRHNLKGAASGHKRPPEMRIVQSVDQLHIDSHPVGGLLHASFKDVCNPELLRDLAQIALMMFLFRVSTARLDECLSPLE